MSKFEVGTQWKTRGGWRAVIVKRYSYPYEIFVAYHDYPERSASNHAHNAETGEATNPMRGDRDLIEPWVELEEYEGWVELYLAPNGEIEAMFFDNEEKLNESINKETKAVLKIKFREGEGLDD